MSSNSGIRGTPLKTSDDEAELGPDSQIIEEEAGLSPNNQIKGYGTSHGVTGSELEEPNIQTGETTPNVTGNSYFTPQAAASNAVPDGELNFTQQAATMAAASESIHPTDDAKDTEDSSFGGPTRNQLLQQLNKLEAESNNLRNELRNMKDNQRFEAENRTQMSQLRDLLEREQEQEQDQNTLSKSLSEGFVTTEDKRRQLKKLNLLSLISSTEVTDKSINIARANATNFTVNHGRLRETSTISIEKIMVHTGSTESTLNTAKASAQSLFSAIKDAAEGDGQKDKDALSVEFWPKFNAAIKGYTSELVEVFTAINPDIQALHLKLTKIVHGILCMLPTYSHIRKNQVTVIGLFIPDLLLYLGDESLSTLYEFSEKSRPSNDADGDIRGDTQDTSTLKLLQRHFDAFRQMTENPLLTRKLSEQFMWNLNGEVITTDSEERSKSDIDNLEADQDLATIGLFGTAQLIDSVQRMASIKLFYKALGQLFDQVVTTAKSQSSNQVIQRLFLATPLE